MKPKSTCDFIVTMQAQKYTPTEMICKDKFLIQSTVVPFGTTEEEITSSMFSKDGGKYIEETKIRVALTSAPNSPEKLPAHGIIKQDQISDEAMLPEEPHSPVLLPVNGISKQASIFEYSKPEVQLQAGNENSPPVVRPIIKMDAATPTIVKEMEESALSVQDIVKSVHTKGEECYSDKNMKSIQVKDDEATNLKLTKEINDLQLKISSLDSKLVEAECIIVKLKEERMNTIGETESLRRQLAMSKKNSSGRKVQVGFPPLFVCMIALINLVIGFMLRS